MNKILSKEDWDCITGLLYTNIGEWGYHKTIMKQKSDCFGVDSYEYSEYIKAKDKINNRKELLCKIVVLQTRLRDDS